MTRRPIDWHSFTPPSDSWKRIGGEWHGPCPVDPGETKDCAWVKPEGGTMGCRQCGDPSGKLDGDTFTAHARAVGVLDADHGSAPPSRRWTWTGPDGEYLQTRPGRDGAKYDMPRGIKRKRYAYAPPSNPSTGSCWILVEGGPAADAAAAKLAGDGVRVLAIASSSRGQRPEADVLRHHGVRGDLLLWPDADPEGHAIMNIVAGDLHALGGVDEVRMVDPDKLGLAGKDDAAEWDGAGGLDRLIQMSRVVPAGAVKPDAEAPPWRWLSLEDAEQEPEPAPAVGRGVLAFGPAAVTAVVSHGKVGKSTATWCDLGPATRTGKVLAIVGRAEMGPGGRADYGRMVYAGGGDPNNVALVEPVPGILDKLDDHLAGAGFVAVVVDSAASLCVAEGVNENAGAEVRALVEVRIRAWNLPTIIIRHSVNAAAGSDQRDPTASRGAGSRDWLAAVDGEAVLSRSGNKSVLTWAGREGLPRRTGFEVNRDTWPWGIDVLGGDDLPAPTGGGGGDDVSDDDAEQAVLAALEGAHDSQGGVTINKLSARLGDKLGYKVGARPGPWWKPYRDAVDLLHAAGRISASRDPSTRTRGVRLTLWIDRPGTIATDSDVAIISRRVPSGTHLETEHHTPEGGGAVARGVPAANVLPFQPRRAGG